MTDEAPPKGYDARGGVEGFASTRAPTPGACLVIVYGAELGKRVALHAVPVEIGRSSQAGLCIPQESVGRHHARIGVANGAHVIVDLGSANGTFVNDVQLLGTRMLVHGDVVRVGRTLVKYLASQDIETAYHEEIYRLMTVDGLTHVHNQRVWREATEREFNRAVRYGRPLSVVLFDLDRFQRVNEVHGSIHGDGVLRQVAGAVRPWLRKQDVFARTGGGEFGVVLPEIDRPDACIVAEKIRKLVELGGFMAGPTRLSCTVSVGVASLTPAVGKVSGLLELAARNLQAAKSSGRNRVVG